MSMAISRDLCKQIPSVKYSFAITKKDTIPSILGPKDSHKLYDDSYSEILLFILKRKKKKHVFIA